MSYQVIVKAVEYQQSTLVKKLYALTLIVIISSFAFIPALTFGAENEVDECSTMEKNKRDLPLELHSQLQQYVGITDAKQVGLDILGDMTISLRVNPTTLSGNMTLVSKWQHVAKTSYLLFIEQGQLGIALNSETNGYGYKVFYAPYTKSANEWALVTMVYTAASGTTEFFIDGVSVGKSADYAMPTSIADTEANFMMGSRENLDTFFDGKIDDVRIWSRAMSKGQVVQLYSHPKKFNGENYRLQGYWNFNDGLKDESVNNNDLLSVL